MRIALLGSRGVPASYGGFETCAEQLGLRLVQRGHEVTVYCRSPHITYPCDEYKGIHLVKLPTIRHKYLDTIVHTLLSSLHALPRRYDVALYFIAGNSLVSWIPRLVGTPTVLNVDGLDWKREKWPALAKHYIRFAEWLATWVPTAFLTDSRSVQSYYRDRFNSEPAYIPYGSDVEPLPPGRYLRQFDLEPGGYVLFVGRLVPENNVHHLLEAFRGLGTDKKCVIVGDAPYSEAYIARLKAMADEQVIFTGYLFDEGYRELSSHAYAFVETSGVGGTHPALMEAMRFGSCVVVNDTAENLEAIGDAGLAYQGRHGGADLLRILRTLLKSPELADAFRRRAQRRAEDVYSWERVTDQYELLLHRVSGVPLPGRLRPAAGHAPDLAASASP